MDHPLDLLYPLSVVTLAVEQLSYILRSDTDTAGNLGLVNNRFDFKGGFHDIFPCFELEAIYAIA